MNAPDNREQWIIGQARERPTAERAAFLDGACAGDVALRERLEALLAAHGQRDGLLGNGIAAATVEATIKLDLNDAPDEAVGQTLGRYRLLERVGEGGCGVVYVAEQTEPVRRRVALKVIKLGMDTKQVVARFEAERQALAIMDHPNIAKVLDAGATDTGRPYFVMELVRGIRITEYCDQNHLSTKERLGLFIKVCQAIQHAHQKGIIHRDIKPSNILVTLHDGVPVPKVIDFGIAKATEGRLTDATVYTQLQQFIGTPAYMSPEQAEMSGLDIDTRSDIYSLGVLLYELLAGSTPFDAKELVASGIDAMRKTIRENEPVRPSTRFATLKGEELTTTAKRRSADTSKLLHQLKGDLDWIVMKCLEKDRTRRYETANGLAADLKRHLNNEPVVARPPSRLYEFQKTVRRHKFGFGAAAALVTVLAVGVVISTWQAARATRAKRDALSARQQAEASEKKALAAQADATGQRDIAQERLLDALLREMHSIATIRQLGYLKDLRDRVRQALELPKAGQRLDQLRAEFTQGLGDPLAFDPVFVDWEPALAPGDAVLIALSPDGHLAAVWTARHGLAIRETNTGRLVAHFAFEGLRTLTFSKDGQALFGTTLAPVIAASPAVRSSFEVVEWRRQGDGSWSPCQPSEQPVSTLWGTPAGVFALQRAAKGFHMLNLEAGGILGIFSLPEGVDRLPLAIGLAPRRRLIALGIETDGRGRAAAVVVSSLTDPEHHVRLEPIPGMGRIQVAHFSPDELFLVCIGETGAVIYETTEFKSVGRILSYLGTQRPVAFVGDGTTIALAEGQRPTVRLLSLGSGTETHLNTRGLVGDLAASTDGTTLMFTDQRGISFVRLADSRERHRLVGHFGGVTSVEFSPDGRLLASTGKDGSVRLWDSVSGSLRRAIERTNAIGQTVNFSPDGRWLAIGDYQHDQIQILSVETGQEVLTLGDARPGFGQTWGCSFTADGGRLVAVGANGFRAWELIPDAKTPNGGRLEARLLRNEPGVFRNLQVDPEGQWVAFSGYTNRGAPEGLQVFVRGLNAQFPGESFPALFRGAVQSLGLVPARGQLAYTSIEGDIRQLRFWSIANRQVSRTMPLAAPGEHSTTYISNLRFSPDGARLAAANHEGRRVNIYDVASGRRLFSLPDESGVIWWLAWHPDGRHLAVARDNGDISIWNFPEVEATLADIGLAP